MTDVNSIPRPRFATLLKYLRAHRRSLAFGGVLLCAIWGALDGLGAVLFYETEFSPADFTVFLPLAAWLVVGYFAVVRFLCYLDLRIRREGWEVELLLRAEGARAGRRLA